MQAQRLFEEQKRWPWTYGRGRLVFKNSDLSVVEDSRVAKASPDTFPRGRR
jgi:hypothetical protein